jgi:hypothetical protein
MAFTIIYNSNGATTGSAPVDPTNYNTGQVPIALGNSGGLAKGSQTFAYWNTAANDSGQVWLPGFALTGVSTTTTLFAQWTTTAGLAGGGATANYNISYDATLSTAAGKTIAQGLAGLVDGDFNTMNGWFGNIGVSTPIAVVIGATSGGAAWSGPFLATFMGASPSTDFARYLITSEVTEMFMAKKANGWGYSDGDASEGSKGEGLSRFLGWQMIQAKGLSTGVAAGFFVSNLWLNSPRVDFVNNNPDDNAPDAHSGCTALFIYYLSTQLKFSVSGLINAGAQTMAGVYSNLTGDSGDPFPFFARLVGQSFPGTNQITIGPNLDDPFPLGLLTFWGNTPTISRDQAKDYVATTGGIAANAFYLILEGFSIDAFNAWGVTVPTPSFEGGLSGVSVQPSPPFGGGPTPAQATPIFEQTTNTKAPQKIRFSFDLKFTDESAFPASGAAPVTAILDGAARVGGNPLSGATCKGGFELLGGANPYFSNVDPSNAADEPYLSQDLRVFQVSAGQSPLPGAASFTSDAYASVQGFIGWLNGNTAYTTPNLVDPLNALPGQTGYETGDSSISPTDGSGNTAYNFAIARVRLRGSALDQAVNCRVFFRLFVGQSADTDFQPSTTFRSVKGTSGVDAGRPIFPLRSFAGLSDPSGQSLQTIPYFATDFGGTHDYDGVVANGNIRTVQIPAATDQVWAYYGCFLDLYDAAGGAEDLAGTHHCIVAEIAYDDAPIPTATATGAAPTPTSWDQLAQRNLQITFSENPKSRATHIVPQAFDLRPSKVPVPLPGTLLDLPDELMIDWGKTPPGSVATIYWPGLDAYKVLALAHSIYASHLLRAADAHTIQCETTLGVTYIPIPHVSGVNFAGLMTIDLPATVADGQVFDIMVRRGSTRMGRLPSPPPPPPSGPRIAIAAPAAITPTRVGERVGPVFDPTTSFTWRQTLGSFQVRIPVTNQKVMLPIEGDTLAILRWRLAHKPAPYRWRPVWKRMIELVEARVAGLGGDPDRIPPSLGGFPGGHGQRPPKAGPGRHADHDRDRVGDRDRDEDEATGKVEGVIYDRFGDFEGFDLRTLGGRRRRYHNREERIETIVLAAWRQRMEISVVAEEEEEAREHRHGHDHDSRHDGDTNPGDAHDRHERNARPIRIILRRNLD